jgi:hypothetical protein
MTCVRGAIEAWAFQLIALSFARPYQRIANEALEAEVMAMTLGKV